ncbi:MAG: glycosyltransferase family 39 protein, partial [Nitrospirae bacterium]|nr:glycosyltransferase family 39 protein [Nitrospirota bacterium]
MEHHKAISNHTAIYLLVCIIAIAAGLRIYGLDRQSLWYDEIVEAMNFQRLINHQTPDIVPPLNSFFLYLIQLVFPDNDFILRMAPVTFGLISVPLLYLLGARLFNNKVGLISSFLLAVSPLHIWYSQDARMYALQWMLALVSIIFYIRTLEKPGITNFTGYIISTLADLYAHQFAVFLILLQGLYLLLFTGRYKQQFIKWAFAFSAVIILYLPWLIYSMTSLIDLSTAGFVKPIDFRVLPYTIFTYCAGFSIGPSLRELHFDQSLEVIKPYLTIIGSIMAVYGTLFLLGIWSMRRDYPKLALIILIVIIPISGALVLAKIKPEITYNVRYTATALLAFLMFVAKGVDWLTCLTPRIFGRILAITAIVVMTGFSAYSYTNYQFNIKYHKADFRSAAAYINEKRMPDDPVICLI